MRIENVQERCGKLGKLVFQFGPDPRREIGECFDQAFYMRIIGGLVRAETESLGDLGVGRSEFSPQAADESELPIVEFQQVIRHRNPLSPRTIRLSDGASSRTQRVPGRAQPGASPRYETGSCGRSPRLDRAASRSAS